MEIEDIKLEQALLAELVAGHQFSVTYLSLPMEVECRISTPAPTRCAKRALEVLLLADRCIATQEVNSLSAMLPAWFLRQFTVAPDAAALQRQLAPALKRD